MTELKRILHVEDDPSIQAVAKVALEAVGGFQVLSCASGQEALDQVQGFAPDFILLDVMMPGMDGPTVLHQLYNNPLTSGIPVVFLTAKTMPGELGRLKDLGAAGVLTKPFDPMQLAADVQALLPTSH